VYGVVRQLGLYQVDCILSGLPFTNFSQSLRDRILDGVLEALKPGGLFIAFQYSPHMKNQLSRRFAKVELSFVPLNIPPAFVYYCHK
jgi:phospholipid N-methyltransferase